MILNNNINRHVQSSPLRWNQPKPVLVKSKAIVLQTWRSKQFRLYIGSRREISLRIVNHFVLNLPVRSRGNKITVKGGKIGIYESFHLATDTKRRPFSLTSTSDLSSYQRYIFFYPHAYLRSDSILLPNFLRKSVQNKMQSRMHVEFKNKIKVMCTQPVLVKKTVLNKNITAYTTVGTEISISHKIA